MLQKLTIRQKKLAEYLLIVAGTAVIAVSLQFFLDQMEWSRVVLPELQL